MIEPHEPLDHDADLRRFDGDGASGDSPSRSRCAAARHAGAERHRLDDRRRDRALRFVEAFRGGDEPLDAIDLARGFLAPTRAASSSTRERVGLEHVERRRAARATCA